MTPAERGGAVVASRAEWATVVGGGGMAGAEWFESRRHVSA